MSVIENMDGSAASAADLARINAVVAILEVGADELEPIEQVIEGFGGFWAQGVGMWRGLRSTMPYLVLGGVTMERLRKRAPLILLCRNVEALQGSVQHCCDAMGEDATAHCAWVRALKPDTLAIIDRIIRTDSTARLEASRAEGRA